MLLREVLEKAILPALAILPAKMDSLQARVQLLATGLQESEFMHRRQMGNGPARGFWQFEKGGGVKGVMQHPASAAYVRAVCEVRGVQFDRYAIWTALETDDIFAAAIARLLLWTDAQPLPAVDDTKGSWALYSRVWNPGKPHPDKWPANHDLARLEVIK